jgi:hypothetical protein
MTSRPSTSPGAEAKAPGARRSKVSGESDPSPAPADVERADPRKRGQSRERERLPTPGEAFLGALPPSPVSLAPRFPTEVRLGADSWGQRGHQNS